MQNLREAIAGYRARLLHEGNDVKRNALLQVMRIVVWCRPVLLVLLPRCLMARWHDHNRSLAALVQTQLHPHIRRCACSMCSQGCKLACRSLAMAVMVMRSSKVLSSAAMALAGLLGVFGALLCAYRLHLLPI